jgi:hypothetical protein
MPTTATVPMSDFVLTKDVLNQIAKLTPPKRRKALRAIGQIEWQRCADDVLYWLDSSRHLVPYVYTKDPKPLYQCLLCNDGNTHFFNRRYSHLAVRHNLEPKKEEEARGYFHELSPIRPWTLMPYMPPIAQWWLREPVMFVEKSRDMMATWLAVALFTWDTIFHRARQNIFQSDDSTKTRELVERSMFIWKNQPEWLKAVHPAAFSIGPAKAGIFTVPTLESEILGFPQGADQIRQYHPSGIFVDEAAFQPDAGAAFAAVKPAIQAGGRYTAVSSANPSFFYLACRDSLDMA